MPCTLEVAVRVVTQGLGKAGVVPSVGHQVGQKQCEIAHVFGTVSCYDTIDRRRVCSSWADGIETQIEVCAVSKRDAHLHMQEIGKEILDVMPGRHNVSLSHYEIG